MPLEYHICYFDLLSFDPFLGEEQFSWLPLKNKATDEKLPHRSTDFFYQGLCFRRQPSEIFFSI